MIVFITFYIVISLMIAAGMLKYEQDYNEELTGVKIYYLLNFILYPIIWPYVLGTTIAKIAISDYVITINKDEISNFEGNDEEYEEPNNDSDK